MTVLQEPRLVAAEHAPRRDLLRPVTWAAAAVAVLGWVPFIGAPASPDEGGFLLVASQWSPGSSLYGNYWVDRPPLLFVLHRLAVDLGGLEALRVIGIAGVVASVFLAGALARTATRGHDGRVSPLASVAPVVVAATFLVTPLFGTTMVDGELLSAPFVLAGMYAGVRAFSATGASAARWAVLAGVAGTSAALVKQNAVDVFVVVAVLAIGRLAAEGSRALRRFGWFAAGAAATLALALSCSALLGTSPAGLWGAVVTFRLEAARAIHQHAGPANALRLGELVRAAVLSAAPLVLAVLGARAVRRPAPQRPGSGGVPDLRWAASAVLVWEVVTIAGGGSYWLHYLLVLVPGMVLLAGAVAQRPPALERLTALVLALALASAVFSTVSQVGHPTADSPEDVAVARYLRERSEPSDSAVIAFGHPDILWDAGMSSPYPELWSLPVRVRDSGLVGLDDALTSPGAPTWVVVSGPTLATWGVTSAVAEQTLRDRYHEVATIGRYVVWQNDEDV